MSDDVETVELSPTFKVRVLPGGRCAGGVSRCLHLTANESTGRYLCALFGSDLREDLLGYARRCLRCLKAEKQP